MELRVENLTTLYSQLCGVLAGFAFAGFSIYVTGDGSPGQAAVAVSLFSAFGSLVLVAVLYSLLSGDASQDRATVGVFCYGLPFGLAIIALFYSLTLIATDRPELSATVWIGRVLVVAVGPVLVLARVTVTALAVARTPDLAGWSPRRFGWLLTVVLLLGATALASLPAIGIGPRLEIGWDAAIPAYVGLGTAIVATLLSPLISTRPRTYKPADIWIYFYIVVAFVTLAAYSLFASSALLPASQFAPVG